MQQNKFGYLERVLFFTALFISTYFLFQHSFNPTKDGPAHLHNASQIANYFSHEQIREYYCLDWTPVPNLFSHAVMAALKSFLPGAPTEKIFLLFYFVFFPLSLRYLIKVYSPGNIILSLIGIPLSHSFLFYQGFYNYCISFAFLFLALGYYRSKIYSVERPRIIRYLVLFFLIALTYFSGILAYVYLLIILLVMELRTVWQMNSTVDKKSLVKRFVIDLLLVLPTIIFAAIFYSKARFYESPHQYSVKELLEWILHFRMLIIFSYQEDVNYTIAIFVIFALLLCSLFYQLFKPSNEKRFKPETHIFLLLALFSLGAYFYIPDGANAGMMSDRLLHLFYIMLLVWIVTQNEILPGKWLAPVFLIPHFLLFFNHKEVVHGLSQTANKIHSAASKIPDYSSVLNINLMQDWVNHSLHLLDYAGVDKPLIIVNNYEANLNWFPLTWNSSAPRFTFNGKKSPGTGDLFWPNNPAGTEKEIEYVFIYGNMNDLYNREKWKMVVQNLDSAYVKYYFEENNEIRIYRHR